MPTKHRRHAITETGPVQAALNDVRRQLGVERVNIAELVILGAQEKLARLRLNDEIKADLRRQLAHRIRERDLRIDPVAAEEVRRAGWSRP